MDPTDDIPKDNEVRVDTLVEVIGEFKSQLKTDGDHESFHPKSDRIDQVIETGHSQPSLTEQPSESGEEQSTLKTASHLIASESNYERLTGGESQRTTDQSSTPNLLTDGKGLGSNLSNIVNTSSHQTQDPDVRMSSLNAAVRESSPHGRYVKLDARLGSGAYKDVWRAYDTSEGIEVAWNVVKLSRVPPSERKRIKVEVTLLRDIEHKNVIKYFNSWVDREKEQIIFITEIMSSGSLKDYLKKNPIIRWNAVKRWCRQILNGLEFLHKNKIIHRDIKCDNIFINGTAGDLRIGDLGLSTRIAEERAHSAAENHERQITSATMTCLGTPEFMAPELYEENYNDKVDIYAFGMTMIEMVTGLLPYHECTSAAQIYRKVLNGELPPELELVDHSEAKEFIRKCLSKQDLRPSATDLLANDFLLPNDEEDYKEVRVKLERSISSLPTIVENSDRAESGAESIDSDEDESIVQEPRKRLFSTASSNVIEENINIPDNVELEKHPIDEITETVYSMKSSASRETDSQTITEASASTIPSVLQQSISVDIKSDANIPAAEDKGSSVNALTQISDSSKAADSVITSESIDIGGVSMNSNTSSADDSQSLTPVKGSSVGSIEESTSSSSKSSRTLLRRKLPGKDGGSGKFSENTKSTISTSDLSVESIPQIGNTNLNADLPVIDTNELPGRSMEGSVPMSDVIIRDILDHNDESVLVFHLTLIPSSSSSNFEVEFEFHLIDDDCEIIAEEMIHHLSHLGLQKSQILKIFQPFVDSSKKLLRENAGISDINTSVENVAPSIKNLARKVLDDILANNIGDKVLLDKLREKQNLSMAIFPEGSYYITPPRSPGQITHSNSHGFNSDIQHFLESSNSLHQGIGSVKGHGNMYLVSGNNVSYNANAGQSNMANNAFEPNLMSTTFINGQSFGSSAPFNSQSGSQIIQNQYRQSMTTNVESTNSDKNVVYSDISSEKMEDITDEEVENDEEYKDILSKYQANIARIDKEHTQRVAIILTQRKTQEDVFKKKRDELFTRKDDLNEQLNVMQNKLKERMMEIDNRKKQLEELLQNGELVRIPHGPDLDKFVSSSMNVLSPNESTSDLLRDSMLSAAIAYDTQLPDVMDT